MNDIKENGSVIITGHILIRDKETNEILLNKSESSLKTNTKINSKDDENNAG